MKLDSKIYVAGHQGLVGSAIMRCLRQQGYHNIITRTHQELELTDQPKVAKFFEKETPEYVFLAAAKVGGIYANNTYPAEFIHQNILVQDNVIHQSWRTGVNRLLFLGSSCIYPRECPQPIREEYLLSGPLEKTNRSYAIAKIAGIETCWAYNRQYGARFMSVMPTNLYGPGDNYNLETSHVLPALIRKMHEAKVYGDDKVIVWGSGKPKREFLFSDDMAEACIYVMSLKDMDYQKLLEEYDPPILNIGCGEDLEIRELVYLVKSIIGFEGGVEWNPEQPDGTTRKMLDVTRIHALGWKPKISLKDGIAIAYKDYLKTFKI